MEENNDKIVDEVVDEIVDETENAEKKEDIKTEDAKKLEELLTKDISKSETLLEDAKLLQALVKMAYFQIDNLNAELKEKEDYKKKADDYLRAGRSIQKDFENYKRQNREAVVKAEETGVSKTVTGLLEIIDNFERAFVSITNEKDREGFEMIYKQFKNYLTSLKVEEIQAEGIMFDPNFHNAVAQIPSDKESGEIVDVIKKGYKIGDNILRYSQVVVAK